ncbi:hypothetical protein [Peterkaempfera bronchialis]|uniref:C2H2-type domain-containing protein n=1 Tax=Peterkaempfera bronchialis TaxID=2126346 RepID=A0A345SZI1_9ACTN|nr:hypothetical protein [Peterkaempfera bronchialis]AXI79136.1 hypothetical protein C7M71_018665 [Peterkaempfera bronchialis]
MSETIGNPVSRPGADPASAATTVTAATGGPVETAHEAYSFACLSCGYGWEQEYEIEHHTDREGHITCRYRANGVRVPSPLLQPNCPGCGGHTIRIMRAGRVAAVGRSWSRSPSAAGPHPGEPEHHGDGAHLDGGAERRRPRRRLHLPFHLHLRRRHGSRPAA